MIKIFIQNRVVKMKKLHYQLKRCTFLNFISFFQKNKGFLRWQLTPTAVLFLCGLPYHHSVQISS